jgi:hypothetical protein
MLRTLLVGLSAVMSIHCSGSDGDTKGDSSTGAASSTTAVTTGATTGVTTGATTSATTDATTTTEPTTGTTGGSSTTTGPITTDPATSNDSMTNGGPAPGVVCGELPPGVVGVEYSTTLAATGGMGAPYSWEFGNPGPPWLSLTVPDDGELAELSGVPTEAGVFMFSVIVESAGVEDQGSAGCELVITEA